MGILDGRVVAITGAGRGIGRELALLCGREGASVIVNDFGVSASGEGSDADPAGEVVEEIRRAGGTAHANLASVTDPEGATSIVEDAVQHFGRIDAVVNNAGFLRDSIWHKMSLEDWRAVIDVHLNGAFNVSKAATPYFREQQSGSFIHFTSTSGLVGNLGQANYSAAKLAIVGLSQSIALDMHRSGVRSNCIAPFAWSRMIATIPNSSPEERKRVERMQAMSADKIAPLVAYLASDRSRDITNQIFAVRKNEIFLFSKPRPVRAIHRSDGWTAERIADEFIPAVRGDLAPLVRSPDVFNWEPV